MQHIETVTVGSGGAASITFSAIPADYTDLLLVLSLRAAFTEENGHMRFNSGGTYTHRRLVGTGSVAVSDTFDGTFVIGNNTFTANTFASSAIYIPNYAGAAQKSFSVDSVSENNATLSYQSILAGLWSLSEAITSITLSPRTAGNLAEHSSASLYGITAGSDGIVAVS